ncbi:MAG: hypothetical protein AB1441_06295 [Bacillota bacterium]
MSHQCSCIAGGTFLQCCGKEIADWDAYRFLLCLGNEASRPFHGRWARHRDLVKRLVDQAAGGIQWERCLVLGAGNCNDIPLDHLADAFTEVTLFDLDESALAAAAARLSPRQRAGLRLLAGDLTGLHASGAAEAIARLARRGRWPELVQYLGKFRKKIRSLPPPELDHGYDLVVSVCVATQLFVPFIRAVAADSPLWDRIHAHAADISRALSNRLGEHMHRSVEPEGAVAFATDILEWNAARLGLAGRVAPLASDSEAIDPAAVDELLRGHSHLKNVGAVPENLAGLFTPVHAVDWIWAFSDWKQYVVRGFVLHPR